MDAREPINPTQPEMSLHRVRGSIARDGVALSCVDFDGANRQAPVLLLHGLAGHGDEWRETASWLAKSHTAFAPDQRGHGLSERRPADVSQEAFVEDAAAWIWEVSSGPAAVVGQSLGGHTALLAARHPELVAGAVIAEASPDGVAADDINAVERWLRSWPVPFATEGAAVDFFGGNTVRARAWAGGLEERADGWWPHFDIDVILVCMDGVRDVSHWEEWSAIQCPTLVVRADRGLDEAVARRMVSSQPRSALAVVRNAGHDVHLDQPKEWNALVSDFLRTL